MGFKIEDIVHPDDQKVAEQFLCGVCMCILNEPVQTACDHIFCEDCITPCLSCPTCRTAFAPGDRKPLRECNRPLLRLMHNLQVWCPYHPDSKLHPQSSLAASASSEANGEVSLPTEDNTEAFRAKRMRLGPKCCDWQGSYMDLLATHLRQCPYHLVPCPRGCGETLRRCDLEAHAPECAKNYDLCPICNESVKCGFMAQHRESKAQLHVQLLEAKLDSMTKRVAGLEATVQNLDLLQKRFNSLGSAMRGAAVQTWEVKISAIAGKARGDLIRSPDFCMGGMGPFRLEYYPQGDAKSDDGKSAIYLYGPESTSFEAKIRINGVEMLGNFEALPRGFTAFPIVRDIFPHKITVELVKSTPSMCTA